MADKSTAVMGAIDELKYILKNGLTPEKQAAYVMGADWIETFHQGITSAIPGAKEAARNAGIEALNSLSQVSIGTKESKRIGKIVADLYASGMTEQEVVAALAADGVGQAALMKLAGVTGWNATGVSQMTSYASGVASQKQEAGAAAGGVVGAVDNVLDGVSFYGYGRSAVGTWLSGIRSKYVDVDRAGNQLANHLGRPIHFSRPPTVGPLSRIREFGPHMVDQWLGPLLAQGRGKAAAVGSVLAGALGTALGSQPPGFALATLAAGSSSPFLAGGDRTVGGGDHYHFHIGTLIANDGGIDELERRMARRRRRRTRGGERLVGSY